MPLGLTHASQDPRPGLGASLAGLVFLTSFFVSCATLRPSSSDCGRKEKAQCEFERAIQSAKQQEAKAQAREQREREQSQQKGWPWADALIEELSRHLADGMDATIVHARTRRLCPFEPGAQRDVDQSWACALDPPLELGDASFVLEYSPDGVLALASDQLDARASAELLAQAVERWRSRCQGQQFEQVEGDTHHEIYRCALPEGPLLVLGRFDRDLQADRWQLSFAMVAVG